MAQSTKEIIQTGEYRTHLNRIGAGNPQAILFLHGSGPGATAWSNWQYALPELGQRYDALAPDLIGFGESEHPEHPPQGMAAWMTIWIQQSLSLLDQLGLERVHLVGNSMGGAVALHLLRHAPDRFDRVVLMGTVGAPHRITQGLENIWGFYDDPTSEHMAQVTRSFVYDPAAVGGDLNQIAQMRLQAALDPPVRRSFEAMFPAPRQRHIDELVVPDPDLQQMAHPVLLIHGRDDPIVPLDTSLYLLKRLPKVQLHVFGQCSHWTQIEYRDAFNRLLSDFFDGRIE